MLATVRLYMYTALIVFLVTTAGWWYYGVKREVAIRADYDKRIERMYAQHREDLEAISALSVGMAALKDGFDMLSKDRKYLDRRLDELKKKDEASRTYLAQPVPSGVQSAAKGSHCLQVPGSCQSASTDDKRDAAFPFD